MIARGMPEVAKIFGDKAFMMAFAQQVMQARLVAQLAGEGGGAGRPVTASPAMARPEGAPPETAGIEPAREGVEPTPAGEGAV